MYEKQNGQGRAHPPRSLAANRQRAATYEAHWRRCGAPADSSPPGVQVRGLAQMDDFVAKKTQS